MSEAVLAAQGLERRFWDGAQELTVLDGVDLRLQAGDTVAVTGASGCGKSTLLHLLGGLDRPTAGGVWVDGQDLFRLRETERGRLRNQRIGFVYQFHHLMAEFTALENVMMPLLARRGDRSGAEAAAQAALERVGLGGRLGHKPSELSGGERQRTAIARAVVTEPGIVLADEPTGNLDEHTAARVFDLLLSLNQDLGTALVVVTHDPALSARLQHRYRLLEGRLRAE
jgi:lipoprotein-releasing system ATP-binding protein